MSTALEPPPSADTSLHDHQPLISHDDMETDVEHPPLARLGRWAHGHRKLVILTWVVLALGFGVFAPRLEHALSGAMWEVNGSESLAAREVIDEQFGGLSSQSAVVVIQSRTTAIDDAAFQQVIADVNELILTEEGFGQPMPPQPGMDGQTVMIQAGANVDPTEAVRAAERLGDDIGDLSREIAGDEITVALTGSPAFWDDFNAVNREGMMKAEILTWPVTAVILVMAFGTLAAAGLPLVLTAAGLIASMGVLYGITQVTRPVDLDAQLRDDVRAGAGHRLRPLHRHAIPRAPSMHAETIPSTRSAWRWTPPARRSSSPASPCPDQPLGRAAGADPGLPLDGGRHDAGGELRAAGRTDPAAGTARPRHRTSSPSLASQG
jgi:hypothetical protein